MPEGQFTGTRSGYVYVTDNGKTLLLQLDDTLATLAGTGLTPYTGQVIDGIAALRFQPRVVYWESTDRTKRKRLICGSPTATLFSPSTAQNLTIDGIAGRTTGRVGEKISFVRIGVADPG